MLFSDISLLEHIKNLNQRQQQLVERLLMLFRILTLLFIILAFAQPYFNASSSPNQAKYHSIYLDNSRSMSWQGDDNISHFRSAKNKALEIIERAQPQDKFNIISNTRHPYQWKWMDKINAKEYLQKVQNDGSFHYLSKMYRNMLEMTSDHPNAVGYLISDFQESILDSNHSDEKLPLNLISITAGDLANLYFGELTMLGTAQTSAPNTLKYVLNRTNTKNFDQGEINIYINGELKGGKSYKFGDQSRSVQDTLLFKSSQNGWNQIMLVTKSSGLITDDTARISCFLSQNYNVLLCHQNGLSPYLQTVFAPEEKIISTVTNISNLKQHSSKRYNMIVLDNIKSISNAQKNILNQMAKNGSSMIFFPSDNMDIANINSYLAQLSGVRYLPMQQAELNVARLNNDQILWKNIFTKIPQNLKLPVVHKYFPMNATGSGSLENLMEFSNGTPYLISKRLHRGYFVSSASDITRDASDFAESYFFLPLLYSLSKASNSAEAYTYDDEEPITLPLDIPKSSEDVVLLNKGDQDVIAQIRFQDANAEAEIPEGLLSPGFWSLQNQKHESLQQEIAINSGAKESLLKPAMRKELLKHLGTDSKYFDAEDSIAGLVDGQKTFALWKLLAIFALITLVLESIVIHNKKA